MRFTCNRCEVEFEEDDAMATDMVCGCGGAIIESFDPADYDDEGHELSHSLLHEH